MATEENFEENGQRRPRSRNEMNSERVVDLQLDRIVASNPEIGPTPPDGGYGWLILISAIIYQVTVPNIFVSYSIIILHSIIIEEYDENHVFRLWDVDIALVPVICLIIRLMFEPLCRTIITTFNMPRIMALAGVCMTVSGILLSSFSTDMEENDIIVNIFAGMFAGMGMALAGQQSEIILKHYFRDKLDIVQTLYKMAPSLGICIFPLIMAYLCVKLGCQSALAVYGGLLIQNCLFLALYTRPLYVVRPLNQRYKVLSDAMEDEDSDIFNRQLQVTSDSTATSQNANGDTVIDGNDIVIANFNSETPKRRNHDSQPVRNENRFSSDFGNFTISEQLSREDNYSSHPQPLYRETTEINENAANGFSFSFDQNVTQGSARRTQTMQRNFMSVISMLLDIQFYLYTMLHLNSTFSILILGLLFAPHLSQVNVAMETWNASVLVTVTHASAFGFILLCLWLPKSINKRARWCVSFCMLGAIGFYGISETENRSVLIIWGLLASFSCSSTYILEQPIYEDMLNEFDALATRLASNTITAGFLMIWGLSHNYTYKICFQFASLIQTLTACAFLLSLIKLKK